MHRWPRPRRPRPSATNVLYPDRFLGSTIVIGGFTPLTFVNLGTPATSDATIRMAAMRMSPGPPCNNSIKIKFFHRSGGVISMFAERGPFTPAGFVTKVTLTPPVDVRAGDLIGVTMSQACSLALGPLAETAKTEGVVQIYGDASGSYDVYGGTTTPRPFLIPAVALSVFGSSTVDAEVRSQIIVAAASATGVGGSRFKTDIQLGNQQDVIAISPVRGGTVSGRLVYHPEATAGSPSDPSVAFTLAHNESKTLLDIVGGLGLSGKGSIDVYTTVGFEPPFAAARVYEDSGGSTKGFTMDAQLPERALQNSGILFTPTDPVKFRMNIGVRTLDRPTSVVFQLYSASGTARVAYVLRSYPANYYVQTEASQLLGMPLQAGDTIVVTPSFGGDPVFVYSSIIDNTSQDPSLQFAYVPR